MLLFTRCLLALLLCLACAARAAPLRLVTEPWAPYVYLHNGQPTGLDYELASEVFRRLGVEVQWQFLPWRRCLMMVEQGQADGVLDIFQTREREPWLLYPQQPLSTVEFVLLQARARPHSVADLAGLTGLRVGTQPAFQYGNRFTQAANFTRESAPGLEANLGKLLLGRIDLLITDRRAGAFAVRQMALGAQVQALPWVVASHQQFLALRRGGEHEALLQRFDQALAQLRQEPRYQEIHSQFADVPHDKVPVF